MVLVDLGVAGELAEHGASFEALADVRDLVGDAGPFTAVTFRTSYSATAPAVSTLIVLNASQPSGESR